MSDASISGLEAASDSSERMVLDREQMIMRYRRGGLKRLAAVASGLFGVGVLVIVGFPVAAGPSGGPLTALTLAFFVIAGAGWLVVGHPFLLSPRYGPWLRALKPFEPETFWGQSLQNLATWLGAMVVLVLGGIIGADLSAQSDVDRMMGQAWEWIGLLVAVGGVYVWWTSFVVKLATSHRRALKRGQLAVPRGTDSTVWLLFLVVWIGGLIVTVVALAVLAMAPYEWPTVM